MTLLVIAFIAGVFSVLTPCILPVLPALMVVSDGQGRARVIGLVAGIVVSFGVAILALTALVDALGVPADVMRYVSATLLLVFALVLLVPALDARFQMAAQSVVRLAPAQHQGNGLVPGFLAGATLGLVWAPCAGPILGGITSQIARDGIGSQALIATLGYCLGMVIPLTAVTFGGRALVGRFRRVFDDGRRVNLVMGVILLATSLLFFTGYDTKLNRVIATNLPFTSTPVASLERGGFDEDSDVRTADTCAEAEAFAKDRDTVEANGYPETKQLCDLGPAPSLEDLGPWLNTPDGKALSPADLKGKVVLVDFWTYSCINCLRTLPYLRSWHEQYADDGLVIVGAHTPEFGFERSLGNVRTATKDLDVDWPVAQDNDYATWDRFANRFWPAKYLIDRDGTLRYVHYGEGQYDDTEDHIRDLLDVGSGAERATAEGAITKIRSATPETYLGYRRADRFVGRADGTPKVGSGFATDVVGTYRQTPDVLGLNEWSYVGPWRVEDERAVAAGPGAKLRLRYVAQDAYLVMSPPKSGTAKVGIDVDDAARPAVTIDANQLYTVADDDGLDERTIELAVPPGVAVYAFTFG